MRVTGASGVRAGLLAHALLVALQPIASGQALRVGGEVRPRYEYRSPAGGSANGFTSMRTRVELSSGLERHVSAFVQLQDVRFWGEEANTLTDFRADNFDLHQGYVELRSAEEGGWRLRLGRQEVGFGEERLVGPVNWTQQGRSFDGLRAGRDGSFGAIDAFAFVLAESAALGVPHESEFFGAYAQLEGIAGGALDLYSLHTHVAGVGTNQATLGARYQAARGPWRYRIEGSYQLGDRDSATVRAFMVGARLGRMVADQIELTLWYDLLSGDPAPGDGRIEAFETLFATNHPFYGLADLFLDIPRHTGGLGLHDVALKLSATPQPDLRLTLDAHAFSVMRLGTLSSRRLGEELDLTARYRYSTSVVLEGGASYVRDGPGLVALGRLTEDLRFLYVMLTAKW